MEAEERLCWNKAKRTSLEEAIKNLEASQTNLRSFSNHRFNKRLTDKVDSYQNKGELLLTYLKLELEKTPKPIGDNNGN